MPCSLGVPLSEPDTDPPGSLSLGLLVREGLVLGEFAGEAVTGGARGCWCMIESSPVGKGKRLYLALGSEIGKKRFPKQQNHQTLG